MRGKSENLISGFYKKNRIFKNVIDNYYIANYLALFRKILPSMNSELAYFNLIKRNMNSEKKTFPILIKLIISKEEGILCFYSRQIIQNKTANKLILKLHKDYGFNFKFSLVNKKRIRESEMYSVSIRRKQTNIDYFQQFA